MITIVYCLIGVPLTLMYVAKMGHAFANAFRVIYHTCCCAICCLACIIKKQNGKHRVLKHPGSDLNDALGALVIGPSEGRKSAMYTPWQIWKENVESKFSSSFNEKTAVPTYLCLLVMAGYIGGGALLFGKYNEWSATESAYFCFVTLTTIGFGDFVPGVDKDFSTEDATDLVLCALYVVVGLALIGMCIDLMQVDVGKKIRWLGRQIGLSKPKHVKTISDTKKERVGLKLSSEALAEANANNMDNRVQVSRSPSHSLEVPSPTFHTLYTKRSISMPNTPIIPSRSMNSRPSGSLARLATDEETSSLFTESSSINNNNNNITAVNDAV